jgi:antitoxin PrlF
MKHYTTTMTQRGQVTVPAEVQRVLGLGPRDKVTFTVEGREVRLASARERLHAVFGSVEPLDRTQPSDFDAQIQEAKEERAERSGARRREP